MAFNLVTFLVTMAANYVLSRLTAPDGPRLQNKEATGGEYGIPMPRLYGEKVRINGVLVAQADIDEDKHKVGGNQTLIGAGMGAAAGFIYAGPVGAVVGGVLGGLFGSGSQQYYYTYSDTFELLIADRVGQAPIEGVDKIWANGKLIFKESESTVDDEEFDVDGVLIWRRYRKNKFFRRMTIYTGHTDQPIDPVISGQQEIADDGAHPFHALAVFEDLELAPFGNSLPQQIELLVVVETGQSLAKAAEQICGPANIDTLRDISTTALNDDALRGYALTSESTCYDALKPLLPAFGRDCADIAGQIRFYQRSQTMRASITQSEMGAHAYGEGAPEPFLFRRATDLDLPRETGLTFSDPDRNYQANTATSQRIEGSAKSNVAVNLPLVLSADEGASAAALMHWDSWLGRTSINFALTDAWLSLSVGMAYGIPFADQTIPYRVVRRLRGANGIIEVEALSDESVTYTANIAGTSGEPPDDDSTLFEDTIPVLIDGPILSDDHDDYGFYVAMAGSAPGWPRGRVEATGNGTVWASIADGPDEAVIGAVTGTLAAGSTTGLDDTLDTTTTLTVVLQHSGMTLEGATDAELDGWKNLAFVGKNGDGEYLQFKTATFVSGTTWNLTNLRRGRRGTDWAIGTHASGEEFVLLQGAGIFRVVYTNETEWGDPLQVRGVTLHQDEDDAAIENFTNTGEGKRPFSPVNVEGTWDGSDNLTVTWDSRSRMFAGGLGIDDNAEWDIEFDGSPDHTETVVAETMVFSAAEQTAAGLTPGDTVTGRVRQTSDVNDGRWREFTIVGPNSGLFLEDDSTPLELEDGSDFELG